MERGGDETDDDLLRALENMTEERDELRSQMQELIGEWLYAELHNLLLSDICFLRHNKVTVLDTPDGKWEFLRNGKRLVLTDTVKDGIAVVRAFGLSE